MRQEFHLESPSGPVCDGPGSEATLYAISVSE